MLSVVTWLWQPRPGYRSQFDAEKVNVLFRMVDRHYRGPHRNVCVTDMPKGLDGSIDVVPAWNDFADVASPHGGTHPSCYRRLRLFHPDAAQWFGERFVSLDLDAVITGDMDPVWSRTEDFVIWGDTNPKTSYNGSMILMTAGARPRVWTTFDPMSSPEQAKRTGQFGSDQGWIGYCLGPGEPTWTAADGVLSYRVHLSSARCLTPSARIVFFHGRVDPWSSFAMANLPWVKEHWC